MRDVLKRKRIPRPSRRPLARFCSRPNDEKRFTDLTVLHRQVVELLSIELREAQDHITNDRAAYAQDALVGRAKGASRREANRDRQILINQRAEILRQDLLLLQLFCGGGGAVVDGGKIEERCAG